MEYGAWWEDLNRERVEAFLYNLPLYRDRLERYPRRGNEALLTKLDDLITNFAP